MYARMVQCSETHKFGAELNCGGQWDELSFNGNVIKAVSKQIRMYFHID